jgi:hypothetical protein
MVYAPNGTSDCDVKSRLLGPALPIGRKERIACSLNPGNTLSPVTEKTYGYGFPGFVRVRLNASLDIPKYKGLFLRGSLRWNIFPCLLAYW